MFRMISICYLTDRWSIAACTVERCSTSSMVRTNWAGYQVLQSTIRRWPSICQMSTCLPHAVPRLQLKFDPANYWSTKKAVSLDIVILSSLLSVDVSGFRRCVPWATLGPMIYATCQVPRVDVSSVVESVMSMTITV